MSTQPPESSAPMRSTTGDSPHEPPVRPWELELLISGAVTFALVQLPPVVSGWIQGALPRMDRAMTMVVVVVGMYGRMILYALIGGFAIHLAARAYWVGLIGLESVFPHGVRWEGTRYGPILRDAYARRVGRLQPAIDRTDRFCSIIFSAAFSLVMLFGFSVILLGVISGLALVISRVFLDGEHTLQIYTGMFAAFALLNVVVTLLDRRLGERIQPESRLGRFLSRAATVMYFASGMGLFGTVWMVLYSNLKRRVFFAGMYVGLFGLMMFTLITDLGGPLRTENYSFLPEGGARVISPEHYESLAPPGREPSIAPTIQSDVVVGPYVKLFIPYSPRRLHPVIPERCPGLRPATPSFSLVPPDTIPSAAQDSVVACLTRLQPARLDGRPLTVPFRLYRHPRTGLRGIIAYIPTAGLAPGEHVIQVNGVPRPQGDQAPPRPDYYIPFWR